MHSAVQHLSLRNKIARILWRTVWIFLFRPSPRQFHGWRRLLLRLFGARLGRRTYVYPSAQIWAPWNLRMGDDSCISHFVDCYCVTTVTLGMRATVSQYSFLCTASHDFNSYALPIVAAPIIIGDHAWVTADVFIGPGVTVHEGAVIGARSTVTKDVEPWSITVGSPARRIGDRDKKAYQAHEIGCMSPVQGRP